MSRPKRETMSNIDAAWRYMEHPTNLMMVCGIMYFEEPITLEQLKSVAGQRLLRYDRFRQKVAAPTSRLRNPVWEEDPDFDIDYHVQREVLPEPGDYATVQAKVNELMSRPLDFERPLWQIHILDNYYQGNIIMMRTHHCIADGMALVSVLLSLTGESAEASLSSDEEDLAPPPQLSSTGNLFQKAGSALSTAGKATGKFLSKSIQTLSKPSRLLELARQGTLGAVTAARLILKTPDPATIFKGPLGVEKSAAWSRAIPLEEIMRLKNATKTTVNDVLLTAMTGGLRRYMESRGENTEGLSFRAAVPVNLRPPGKVKKLGNYFGLVFLSLPVGIADPLKRLFELKKRMDAIKSSPEAIIALGILKAVGMTPAEIQRIMVNVFGAKTTAVMTNVPGPRDPLYLGGKKVHSMMFWVPCSGRMALGISILSYAGQVRLGVASDTNLIPDPDEIIKGFYKELDHMMDLVNQEEQNSRSVPSGENDS